MLQADWQGPTARRRQQQHAYVLSLRCCRSNGLCIRARSFRLQEAKQSRERGGVPTDTMRIGSNSVVKLRELLRHREPAGAQDTDMQV